MAAKSTPSLKKRSMAAARKVVADSTKAPVEIVATPAVAPAAVAPVVVAPVAVIKAVEAPVMETAVVATEVTTVAGPSAECLSAIADLHHVDADVARDAATALGQIGNAAAVEPLIAVVTNAYGYYHTVVRIAAAASLGQLGDARAIDALTKLVGDWVAEASAEAVRALAKINDARATMSIRAVIDDETGYYAPIVRHAAEAALPRLLAA